MLAIAYGALLYVPFLTGKFLIFHRHETSCHYPACTILNRLQVTVPGDRDEEPRDRWGVSQGDKKGKGRKTKREKEAGTFRVKEGRLFKTREDAEQYLQQAIGRDTDGYKRDDEGDGSDKGDERGTGFARGVRRGTTRGWGHGG